MLRKSLSFAAAFAALSFASACVLGHELDENRATLALRDKTHISITLYLAYTDALHLALAPQQPMDEFLVTRSAMKPEELQRELLRAQAKFQAATHVFLSVAHGSPGRELTITNWAWPEVKQVQYMIQSRIMQAVVDPNGHAHDVPVEIRADANSTQEIESVTVLFPEEFRRVLVVSFRPKQVWAEPKGLSPEIKF